jgi:serine/threonine-protein kinase
VYRARRGGRLYTLKFLSLASPDWAWRELEVRLRLRRVGELAVESHGLWPHEAPRYLYLVTPYVRGRPVSVWARWKNPTAREMARLLREVARQLAAVHAAGVVHRDVKSTNVLVRHGDGGPVLVDFGVSTYVGAPEITVGLPGTRHYRSPEALRFRRERAGEHSPARASDDLWALGVVLYWLLTGAYPFDTEVQDEGVLANVILKHEPEPPHVCNPRVPRALSELCLRMLEKRVEARYSDAKAVGSALEAVLAEADALWDVALCEAWGPDAATTPQEERLGLADWRDKTSRLFAYARRHPRRGLPVPLEEASTLPRPPEEAPPGGSQAPADESPAPPPPRARFSRWRVLGSIALALGLVGLLVLGRLLTREVVSRPTISEVTKSGQEVASPVKPPEGESGAVPARASTPAPVAMATPRKDGKRVRTPQQASTQNETTQPPPRSSGLRVPVKPSVAAVAACTLLDAGCTATTPQVRPEPPAITCPQGWTETHESYKVGLRGIATVKGYKGEPGEMARVKDGPATLEVDIPGGFGVVGFLPRGTLLLGTWQLGEDRLFGTFTEARIPGVGTLPVCLVVGLDADDTPYMDERGKIISCPPGRGQCLAPGSKSGNAKTPSRIHLRPPTGPF